MEQQQSAEKQLERITAIDRFRGIAVFCMIFFQFIKHFNAFGVLTKIASHSVSDGIVIFKNTTIADLIAPMFMFAIALTFKISYDRRVKLYGKTKTNIHFVLRNLALVGFGSFLGTVNTLIDMLSGEALMAFDYVYFVLSGLILLSLISILVFSIKPLKKHKALVKKVFGYLVSSLGLITLVFAFRDFVHYTIAPQTAFKSGYWLVLQALGMAGLVALPFMGLKLQFRALASGLLILVYGLYYHLLGGLSVVGSVTQGGLIGGFGWAFIILSGSVFSEIYLKDKKLSYLITLGMVLISVSLYILVPIQKSGVRPDPTYVITTSAISMLVFLIVDLFNFYKGKFDPLAWWGKYPILLYLFEFGIIGLFNQVAPASIQKEAPLWLAIIIVALFISAFTTIVYWLNKKNKKINF